MNLRFKYILYIILVHAALTLLLYFLLKEKKYIFLASEAIILISLFISFYFYRNFMYPFHLLESGKNVIKDEDFTIKYVPTGNQEVDNLIHVYNHMIERLRSETTKGKEQSYFLENIIESSPLGMIIMDFDQNIDIINNTAKKILETKNPRGKKLTSLNHPLAKNIASLNVFQEKIFTIEGLKKYKCKIHQVVHQGFPRQFVLIEELTKELLEAEKHAYGKVIRMMAHEVNNSMGAVNSILESITEEIQEGTMNNDDIINYLKISMDRNENLGKFTDHFAEVVRLPIPNRNPLDINKVIEKVTSYYRLTAKDHNIQISLFLNDSPVRILGDELQLEQVFSNIIKNSIESIEEDGYINIYTNSNPASIVFEDDGSGISIEIESNLFKPFFSTKPTGQGVGLMLIREILQNHHAVFKLSTEQKSGKTRFDIRF